jgi:nitroreductase
MDFEEVVKSRRSIRKFRDEEVPTQLILKAIDIAVWAPSSGNTQPWKFFVVKDRKTIDAMADAVQSKADVLTGWPEAAEFGDSVAGYRGGAASFRAAPAIIAIAVGGYGNLADKIAAKRGDADPVAREVAANRAGINNRAQNAASVTAHLLLALHSVGLGGCWMAGAMVARQELQRLLSVPEEMELFTIVPIGFPAESPAPGPRKPQEEVVRII